jgi:hypothetical protein
VITTTIAPQRAEDDRTARPAWTVLAALVVGALAGAVLGALARAWMRLISTEPEFTWAGSLFIVIAFAVLGLGQAISWTARHRSWRRPGVTVARVAGGVLALPIFGGAGSIMLPTVLFGALAVWRTDWPRWGRVLATLVALPTAVLIAGGIVSELGLGIRALAGLLGFVAIYLVVIVALGPTVAPFADGWRMSRRARRITVIGGALLGLAAAMPLVGI